MDNTVIHGFALIYHVSIKEQTEANASAAAVFLGDECHTLNAYVVHFS